MNRCCEKAARPQDKETYGPRNSLFVVVFSGALLLDPTNSQGQLVMTRHVRRMVRTGQMKAPGSDMRAAYYGGRSKHPAGLSREN